MTRVRVSTAGAVRGGGAGERDDQPGVVLELAVPGQQPAAQPVGAQRRGQGEGLGAARAGAAGAAGARGAGGGAQQVAGAEPGPREPRPGARDTIGSSGISIGSARVRCGAVRVIRMPRSTALSWATPTWPLAR